MPYAHCTKPVASRHWVPVACALPKRRSRRDIAPNTPLLAQNRARPARCRAQRRFDTEYHHDLLPTEIPIYSRHRSSTPVPRVPSPQASRRRAPARVATFDAGRHPEPSEIAEIGAKGRHPLTGVFSDVRLTSVPDRPRLCENAPGQRGPRYEGPNRALTSARHWCPLSIEM